MWFVYILHLKNDSYYTGITNDIEKRIKVHISGKGSKYVRAHLPCRLVYVECTSNRSEASKREAMIKRMKRLKKIELIDSSNNVMDLEK